MPSPTTPSRSSTTPAPMPTSTQRWASRRGISDRQPRRDPHRLQRGGAEMSTVDDRIDGEARQGALARLARLIMRHRRVVAGGWIVLTIFGAFSAQQVSKRWLEQFSIPGFSAYEANQRTLRTFGSGAQAPNIAVLQVKGDVTKSAAARETLAKVSDRFPNFRTSS